MATIRPNENAPLDSERYDLASDTIFVKPGDSIESNDPVLVANAAAHPWLDVEGAIEEPEADEPEADEPEADEPEADEPEADSLADSGFFAAGDND